MPGSSPGLPAADRLARDEEARGEFFLGEAAFASGLGQGVFSRIRRVSFDRGVGGGV